MIEIKTEKILYPYQLLAIAETVGNYAGPSTGWFGTIARLKDVASQDEIDEMTSIINGYDQMVVNTDVSTITADDVDIATITATAGNGDTSIRFDIWDSEGDHAIDNEVVAVAGGQASYQFKTALAETYTVFAYGNVSHEMGSIEVIANE